jgi:hypothetical protein
MSNLPQNRSARVKFLPFGIALIVTLLVPALILVILVRTQAPWHSRPDAIRPWAGDEYERTLSPSTRRPLPTLADLPLPDLKIDDSEKGLEITGPTVPEPHDEPFHELFVADANGIATLPDGTRLTLEAIALLLPSDPGEGENGSYPERRPDWVRPMTGAPYTGNPDAAWSREPQALPRQRPSLHLHVKKEGDLPVRWHAPELFDTRTRVSLNSVSSYSHGGPDGDFWCEIGIWHQTVVEITVPFAFGPIEEQTLDLKEGATATFGTASRVEVLQILPGRVSSYEWGDGTNGFRIFLHRPVVEPGMPPQRTPILFVWPPPSPVMIESLSLKKAGGSLLHGHGGIAHFEQTGTDATATSIRLRRFPRLGRAVFRVPTLPRLPVADNLFAVPIPKTRIDSESAWLGLIAASVEGRAIHSGSGAAIPENLFPMEVENTTPAKLLADYERQLGKPVHFDESTFELGDRPPPGLLDRIAEWWRSTGIGSFRRGP